MKNVLSFLLLIGFIGSGVGCRDTVEGKSLAEPGVSGFHDKLAAKEFDRMYAEAGDAFKEAIVKEKAVALFSAIDRKLGKLRSTEQINWQVNTRNGTTYAVLVYKTLFEKGEATETFTFHISDGKAELVGYNISSLDMLIN